MTGASGRDQFSTGAGAAAVTGKSGLMTDPAVEAAQRAWYARYHASHNFYTSLTHGGIADGFTHAAREALKLVREAYTRWESAFGDGQRGDTAEIVQVLLEELAPLIYTSEELER